MFLNVRHTAFMDESNVRSICNLRLLDVINIEGKFTTITQKSRNLNGGDIRPVIFSINNNWTIYNIEEGDGYCDIIYIENEKLGQKYKIRVTEQDFIYRRIIKLAREK